MTQQGPTEPSKPGWTTTEFYQSLLLQVVAVVVAIVTIFRPDFNLDSFQALIPMIAVALAAIAQIAYTISRTKVKVAALNAAAPFESQVVTTQQGQVLASPAARESTDDRATAWTGSNRYDLSKS